MSENFTYKDVIEIFRLNIVESSQSQMVDEILELPNNVLLENNIVYNQPTPINDGHHYYSTLAVGDIFILTVSRSGEMNASKANVSVTHSVPMNSRTIDQNQGLIISTLESDEDLMRVFHQNQYLIIRPRQIPPPRRNAHTVILDFTNPANRKIIFG